MNRLPFFAFLVCSLISIDGADARTKSKAAPLARVNGQDLGRGSFDQDIEQARARFRKAGRAPSKRIESRIKQNLFEKLLQEELVRQHALLRKVEVPRAELNAAYAAHKKRFGSAKAYKEVLKRTHRTEKQARAEVEQGLIKAALMKTFPAEPEVTKADAKAVFDESRDQFKEKEKVRAHHILFKLDKGATREQRQKQRARAEMVLAKAKKKGADFAKLAKKYSEGPTKTQGGSLGTFSRGRMVRPFEEAAFAAEPGSIVGPVETQFGLHLIWVQEKLPERARPFDEVEEQITLKLEAQRQSRATAAAFEEMMRDMKLELLEPGLQDPRKLHEAKPAEAAPAQR